MITVTHQPASPVFTSALDTFPFKISGENATVTISCGGEELLSETYFPVAGNITIYDLGTLIADAARRTVVATCQMRIIEHTGDNDTDTWESEFTVYYSTVDVNMSCTAFLNSFFLTLLDGVKLTQLGYREYLHAAGDESTAPVVVAKYFKDSQVVTATIAADATSARTANGITTFDVSPDRYYDETKGNLFAYTVTVGKRVQEYQIDHSRGVADPVLLFTNSFGCQEIFYCLGKKKIAPTFERKQAVISGRKINYSVKETRTFEGDTGIIPPSMAHFAEDLLRSDEIYLFRDYVQDKEITFTDSKSERTNEDDDLAEFTFSYQYAQRVQNVIFKDIENTGGRIFDDSFDDTFN